MAQYGAVEQASKNIWGFDPTSVTGCVLWLDGADANTVFSDSAGTTPSTVGGNVVRWRDKSISANNANSMLTYPTTAPAASFNWPISTATTISYVTNIPTTTFQQGLTAGNTLTVTGYAPSQFNVTDATILSIATSYSVSVSGNGTFATYTITSAAPNNTTLGLISGSNVTVSGFATTAFNGTFAMVSPTSTTFTRSLTTSGTASGGTVVSIANSGTNGVITVSSSAASGLTVTSATSPAVTWKNTKHPTLSSSSVAFTGGQYFGLTANLLPQDRTNTTYFIVASTSSSSRQTIFTHGANGNGTGRYFQYNYIANNASVYVTNAFPYASSGAATLSNINVLTGLMDNSIVSGWINGNPFTIDNKVDAQLGLGPPTAFTSNASIGIDYGYTTPLSGNIYEILIYNSTLPLSQQQAVEGYLAWKWGVQNSLPSTHPYSNNAITPQFTPNNFGASLWYDASDSSTISGSGTSAFAWTDKTGLTTSSRSFSVQITGAVSSGGFGVYTVAGTNTRGLYQNNSINVNGITGITGSGFNGTGTITNVAAVGGNLEITTNIAASGTATGFSGTSRITPNTFPSVSVASVNSLNAVSILDSASAIQFATLPSIAQLSFFYVCSGSAEVLDTNSYSRLNLSIASSTLISFTTNGNATNTNATVGAGILTNPVLLEVTSPGVSSTGTAYVNGSQVGTFTTGSGTFALQPVLSRDRGSGFPALYCEIIAFTELLSTSRRQQIEGYLMWKWGLQASLPATHPYALANYFYTNTRAFSRNFVPTDIEGCQLWIDPADTNTVTLNGSSKVTDIVDKSGLGNNLTNSSSTITYVSTLNGLPVLTFPTGGGSNTLTTPSVARDPLRCSWFFVIKYGSSVAGQTRLIQFNGTNEFIAHNGASSAQKYLEHNILFPGVGGYYQFYTVNTSDTASDFFGNKTYVIAVVRDRNVGVISTNGTSVSTIGNGTTGTPLATGDASGAYAIGPFERDAVVGDIIIYNSALTAPQRQQVEGYLMWKWGMQRTTNFVGFPTSHPLYRNPPPSVANIRPNSLQPKREFNPYDLSPVIWVDAQDNSLITTNSTTSRIQVIENKGTLPYQSFTVSSSTGDTLTLSAANAYFAVGQPVVFTTAPTGLVAGTKYYIHTYTPAGPTFKVTSTIGGATAISSLSESGSGYLIPAFTAPMGTTIEGPLVTTNGQGVGIRQQFLDFSNGGYYRVTGVVVGPSPFTELTLTVSPPHNGAIGVGKFVNFTSGVTTATNINYPSGASAVLNIGPHQILTATVVDNTTLEITTLVAHNLVNSQSVHLTINSGTFFGGTGDASTLTGPYTTGSTGTSGTFMRLTIASSTNGLMAISDGHVRNNLGTSGPYLTQAGTTGSTVILTSYSPRGTAGSVTNFVGYLESGQITVTSANLSVSPNTLTFRTPINHGLTSGDQIGVSLNTNFTFPFQNTIPAELDALNGAAVGFTNATISGTTLTITFPSGVTNPFFTRSVASPKYDGISVVRMTLLAGTQFATGTSAMGLTTGTTTLAGSDATKILLSITSASPVAGTMIFTGLPGILDSTTSTGATAFFANSTTTASAGTTGNTIVCPLVSARPAPQINPGRVLKAGGTAAARFTSDNPSVQGSCILSPLKGYALENRALSTSLNTNKMTIIWVSCLTQPYNRSSFVGSSTQPSVLSAAVTPGATGGADTTSGGRDFRLQTASFAGQAPRMSIVRNNAGTVSKDFYDYTSTISHFRIHHAIMNYSPDTVDDVGQNTTAVGIGGWGYRPEFFNGTRQAVAASQRTGTLVPTHLRIGAGTQATDNYTTYPLTDFWYEGGIGDIMIFNSILTFEERKLVEGYLAEKYRSQLSIGSAGSNTNTLATANITGTSVTGTGPYTITLQATFQFALTVGTTVNIQGATPTTLNRRWTISGSSQSQIQIYSDTSITWTSGGTITGTFNSGGNFVHPYRGNSVRISQGLDFSKTYTQGLAAWFDAANSSTIGFASSNNVNSWTSGGGTLSLTLGSTGTSYPTLVQDAQNGLPGMRFASSGTPLGTSSIYGIREFSTVGMNNDFTIITVYKQPTFTSGLVISNITGNTTDPRLTAYTNQFSYRSPPREQTKSYSAADNERTYVTVYYRRDATLFVRDNGTQDTGATTSGTNLSIATSTGSIFGVTLGAYSLSSITDIFVGDIYEHIIFRYALTDQLIFQIEGYLAWKWGVQTLLPTTHPYYKVRP